MSQAFREAFEKTLPGTEKAIRKFSQAPASKVLHWRGCSKCGSENFYSCSCDRTIIENPYAPDKATSGK